MPPSRLPSLLRTLSLPKFHPLVHACTHIYAFDRDLARYDVARKAYVVDAGDYEIALGASSADIRLKSRLAVSAE